MELKETGLVQTVEELVKASKRYLETPASELPLAWFELTQAIRRTEQHLEVIAKEEARNV